MEGSIHLGNVSIVTAECVALRHGVVSSKYNGFSNLDIEEDSKVPSSIILLMEDI